MSLHLLLFSIVVVGLFSVVVLGLHVLLLAPRSRNAQLLAFLCANSACARVLAWHEYGFWIPTAYQVNVGLLAWPMDIARNFTPGLLMLLCHSLFRDDSRFPRWLAVAFVVQVLMEALAPILSAYKSSQTSPFEFIPALLQLVFLGHALYWILWGWPSDMVENRRRARWVFLLFVATYIFITVMLQRLLVPWQGLLSFQVHIVVSIVGASLAVVALIGMLRSDASAYIDPLRLSPARPQSDAPSRVQMEAAILNRALSGERIYREAGLTISRLAARLKIPEYRLRKLIHESLGYRNFNALLHDYRIREACELLSDPARRDLPILTIALSIGYNSINPFNRAFKELKGTTPSAFKAGAHSQPLIDS